MQSTKMIQTIYPWQRSSMKVSIAYINPNKKCWLKIDVPDESTVLEAIKVSGILEQFPDIDLDKQKIGIYGRFIKPDAKIKEGDRIEIYRPIIADPKTVKRRDKDESD